MTNEHEYTPTPEPPQNPRIAEIIAKVHQTVFGGKSVTVNQGIAIQTFAVRAAYGEYAEKDAGDWEVAFRQKWNRYADYRQTDDEYAESYIKAGDEK